ncbi:uncharacterized protein LOC131306621 isoform X1 [Rhododendron vialii]|uniref:uncharacterized protein LOC131306621 isoform X1 n=1 Tax=Rhododendron vialii TaxID=182163 RepID=UPI00265EC2A4|nr:uncharacterized protein LOC131306621 isoform X1 [Rhododendron vialii]XP_058188960.1 uncharacterized protein LOC131306621 isoform X1 [Rhododendron vialii]
MEIVASEFFTTTPPLLTQAEDYQQSGVCQYCGGKGFENAFVYCITCLSFAVHRYCLPVLPKTFDEFVRWYCEDCEPKSANHSPPENPCSSPSRSPSRRTDHLISKGVRVKKSKKKLKKKNVSLSVPQTKDQGQQRSPSQPPSDAKTKLDCTAHALQSSLSQEDSDARTQVQLTEHAQLASDCSDRNHILKGKENTVAPLVNETEEQKRQSSPSEQPCEAQTGLELCVASCSPLTTMQHSMAETEEQLLDNSSEEPCEAQTELASRVASYSPVNENTTMQPSVAETMEQICESSPSQQPCEAKTELALCVVGPTPLNDTIQPCSENYGNGLQLGKRRRFPVEGGSEFGNEAELVKIDDSKTTTGDLSHTLENNYHLHAQPVSDRIWRGSFSIRKKIFGIFDGVVAHLSSKACQKVCKVAALLPAVLYLEMLPKSALWPENFQKSEPSDEHIGLYFFAESKWYEWVFDCLVDDMIDQDLAMRASVKNAELLVFPSAELPLQYWKFQGKYYLWGVFRKKQDSSFHLADQGLQVEKGNTELVVYSNSENGVDTGDERNLSLTKTRDAQSPRSPLSNSCRSGPGPC